MRMLVGSDGAAEQGDEADEARPERSFAAYPSVVRTRLALNHYGDSVDRDSL